MTEAEKIAKETVDTLRWQSAKIAEQEAKIKRMAEALADFHGALSAFDKDTAQIFSERHADALRDAGVSE
jgi:hypothetical protein